ncbi:MAG TPA: hypothetical protein VF881_10870 [Polyangiaceae bacterium]
MSGELGSTTDEAEIREMVESWASAVRRKDLDGILCNHSPDILMFDVPPPLQSKGIEEYKRTWESFYSWSRDPVLDEASRSPHQTSRKFLPRPRSEARPAVAQDRNEGATTTSISAPSALGRRRRET